MFSPSTVAEMRRLLTLAWPVVLTSAQWIALNTIDTAMVGHAGASELAFMNAGRVLTWTAMNISFGLLSGVIVFAARADGAGDRLACGAVLRQGLGYGLIISLVTLLALVIFSAPLMAWLDIPADQRSGAVPYTHLMALAIFVRGASLPITYFLEGISRPRPAMVLAMLTLPINALLNWIFIFGKFGFPALGARGAALGTLLAISFEAVALVLYLYLFDGRKTYGLAGKYLGAWRGVWQQGAALRKFGIAPAFAAGMENIGFSLMSVLAAQLGAVAAAAYQSVLALHIIALAGSIGFASAAGVRVGNAVGERAFADIARRGWLAAGLTVAATVPFSLVYMLFPAELIAAFDEGNSAMRASALIILLIVAPFILFDALQIVLVYALRAAGDPVFAAINQTAAFPVLMVAVSWLLIHKYQLGVAGIGIGLVAGIIASAALMSARYVWITRKEGAWIKQKNPTVLPG